ncbi:NADP-dependent oxidoreductase [Mycolicibacterium sp. P1-18]|uniref:NADP-dependent oxidoreductase n=1 Tax=Mycolicibacterium sp. P1-18 TaxID=2024615 RepID=UPI0011F20133|nr:NADP-dependent oxidoreductase [Mycolicibacterium sp. P1-18]KAA0094751.1 NADP-dependent oxidoreductase [Mycolicibacterium sp. P1-18]
MKTFTLDRYAKRSALRAAEMPEPRVGDDDVLVDVHAAGVNVLDVKIRDGEFKPILPYRLPQIMGNDVAGVVTRVGARVRAFTPGDEVYARPDKDRIGTFAESIAMKQRDVAHKPAALNMVEAAPIPLVALTAWQALVETANLQRGQKVFIQAGSGGVGTIAIQLAKHLGATVATTCSPANFELVKGLGADVVVDYRSQDFDDVLHDYDVVLHSQDDATLKKSLRILARGGTLISISGPPDHVFGAEIGAAWYLRVALRALSAGVRRQARQLGVGYHFLFMRASGEQLQRISALIDSGAIRPVLDRVFPFAETNDAMAYVESGRAKGKVVIKVTPTPA